VRGPGGLISGAGGAGFDLPGMGGPPIRAEKKATLLDLAPVKAASSATGMTSGRLVSRRRRQGGGRAETRGCGATLYQGGRRLSAGGLRRSLGYANLLAVLRDPKHEDTRS